MSSQVINLKTGISTSVPSVTGNFLPDDGLFELQTAEPVSVVVQEQLEDLKIIYGEPSAGLSGAIAIISDCIAACTNAIEAIRAGDKIQADSFMLNVQSVLPDLFKARQIGDGFGIISTALMFSFGNKRGGPFSNQEIHAILRALKALWSTPYISMERAVDITGQLDEAGLIVDPTQLTDLFVYAEEAGLVDG